MSDLEEQFAFQLRVLKLPPPVREFRFHGKRKWRLDFAWPDAKVAIEVEGGTWNSGRHTRGAGFEEDCRKYAAAVLLGWTVFRATGRHVQTGEAFEWIEAALGAAKETKCS